jgi:hypothetical protein
MSQVLATNHVTQIIRISRKRGVVKEQAVSYAYAASLDGAALASKGRTLPQESSSECIMFAFCAD